MCITKTLVHDDAMAKLSSLAVLVKRARAVTVHVPAEEWRVA